MNKGAGEKEAKSTLVDVTRSFINLLKANKGEEVDLSVAEKLLGASKRRLYDVSNVLAGIGLIERDGKSKVKWVGKTAKAAPMDIRRGLEEQSRRYDNWLRLVDEYLADLSQSPDFTAHAWMTESDISKLDPEGNVNLFALRGPPSMTIQILDEGDGQHHLVCKSEDGKIEMVHIGTESVQNERSKL